MRWSRRRRRLRLLRGALRIATQRRPARSWRSATPCGAGKVARPWPGAPASRPSRSALRRAWRGGRCLSATKGLTLGSLSIHSELNQGTPMARTSPGARASGRWRPPWSAAGWSPRGTAPTSWGHSPLAAWAPPPTLVASPSWCSCSRGRPATPPRSCLRGTRPRAPRPRAACRRRRGAPTLRSSVCSASWASSLGKADGWQCPSDSEGGRA
mmetsp:Transcript_29827/g.92665  ORF Transcript_29827/g.92665 Transcript_29827/m.92665 type:complete len:212 (-) Transcript_29827:40-675(-)